MSSCIPDTVRGSADRWLLAHESSKKKWRSAAQADVSRMCALLLPERENDFSGAYRQPVSLKNVGILNVARLYLATGQEEKGRGIFSRHADAKEERRWICQNR